MANFETLMEVLENEVDGIKSRVEEEGNTRDHDHYLLELTHVLHTRGFNTEKQKAFSFRGYPVIPDITVENVAIITAITDSGGAITSDDLDQMRKFREAAGLNGIIINFGIEGSAEVKQVKADDF